MRTSALLSLLLATSAFAGMPLIEITGNGAFDYFGSLYIWLIITVMPFLIAFGLLANIKRRS